jgi:hypothetical protein
MNKFEKALWGLVKLFPQHYEIRDNPASANGCDNLSFFLKTYKKFWGYRSIRHCIDDFTQDDIDTVLHQIGWVYTQRVSLFDKPRYKYFCQNISSGEWFYSGEDFDSKIESARQALIEIVNIEQEREKNDCT